jgi:hypothetical protein
MQDGAPDWTRTSSLRLRTPLRFHCATRTGGGAEMRPQPRGSGLSRSFPGLALWRCTAAYDTRTRSPLTDGSPTTESLAGFEPACFRFAGGGLTTRATATGPGAHIRESPVSGGRGVANPVESRGVEPRSRARSEQLRYDNATVRVARSCKGSLTCVYLLFPVRVKIANRPSSVARLGQPRLSLSGER